MRRLMLCLPLLLLAACGESDHQDMREWMATAGNEGRIKVQPLPDVKPYTPVPYAVEAQLDPFKAARLVPEAKQFQNSGKGGGLQPNFDAREMRNSPLERYPLESLRMVGYLRINNKPIGVIQADQTTKQVKVGEYVGTDFGLITKITEQEITLREMVQDSGGEWTERTATLPLMTNREPGK